MVFEALKLRTIKLKWNKEEFDVTVEEGTNVEAGSGLFRPFSWPGLQDAGLDADTGAGGTAAPRSLDAFSSLRELRKFIGFPGGILKDSDDLMAKAGR